MGAQERTVPAMGSLAHVIVVDGPDGLMAQTLARLRDLESRWSRFLADSEVSRLNAAIAHGDEPPALSADTLLLLERAAEGFRITNGRFDATRLGAVAAAGYERSLERYGPTVAGIAGRVPIVGFDPGGIGKGLAADIVSRELVDAGATGALVSIGGDLRVRGTAPDGGSWRIDIEDPRDGSILTAVTLDDGAVATSSQLKRRWTATDGTVRHHLIDPATGVPSQSPVLSATVIAGEAWQAEVLTKVAFLDAFGDGALSDDAGLDLVERLSTAALVVTPDLVLTTSRWHRFEQSPTGRDRAGV